MIKYIFIAFCTFAVVINSYSQVVFSGEIEYSRETNFKRYYDMLSQKEKHDIEKANIKIPKKIYAEYNLKFDKTESFYTNVTPMQNTPPWFADFPGTKKYIYINSINDSVYCYKDVLGEKFYVKKTSTPIRWKIHEEIRTYLGYSCQKAVGVVQDSIYIVAFFSEDFFPSVGPEGINGLPGGILFMAIPQLHTTWTATAIHPLKNSFDKPNGGEEFIQYESYKNHLLYNLSKASNITAKQLQWALL